MKTIEEVAFNRYISDQKLPKHKRMQANCYIDWANLGAIEAQRWIPVNEELPEVDKDDMWNETHNFSKKVITKNDELTFTNYEIQAYNTELQEWQTSNKVTHWRPIERK